jgi:DNA-binding MarR family transcriptional regulator
VDYRHRCQCRADLLTNKLEHEFQPFGWTVTQYNVMRLIRGAGPSGISQRDIGNRKVTETPDVPRLLKRLETSGLIRRTPDLKDRRILTVSLKPSVEKLLREMDLLVKSINDSFFSKLSNSQLQTLNQHLYAFR